MLYAINKETKEKELPSKEIECYCPCCNTPVKAKMGMINTHHWAHTTKQDCLYNPQKMTEWHINWQKRFDKNNVEVRHEKWKNNIADVCLGNPDTDNYLVLEFQHSPISLEKVLQRNEAYKNIIWVLDYTNDNSVSPKVFEKISKDLIVYETDDYLHYTKYNNDSDYNMKIKKSKIEDGIGYEKFFKNLNFLYKKWENKQYNSITKENLIEEKNKLFYILKCMKDDILKYKNNCEIQYYEIKQFKMIDDILQCIENIFEDFKISNLNKLQTALSLYNQCCRTYMLSHINNNKELVLDNEDYFLKYVITKIYNSDKTRYFHKNSKQVREFKFSKTMDYFKAVYYECTINNNINYHIGKIIELSKICKNNKQKIMI